MHKNIFQYTKKEEFLNTLTHGLGIPLGIFFLISLIFKAVETQETSRIISYSIFGGALILVFLSSSLYHYSTNAKLKLFFKRCDHSCIYLFMAASYTPYIIHHFDEKWTIPLLSIVWLIAIVGIIYKLVAIKKRLLLSLTTYISYGVLFFAMKLLIDMKMSDEVFYWLLAGGGFYIIGTVFYALKKIPYSHAIWHVFVICGVTSQYISLLYSSELTV
jgi:hemolysin III